MRIFKTRWFDRWAAKEALSEQALRDAVAEIAQGLIDARLGGQIVKKRIGIDGRGKSGGMRTIVAFELRTRRFLYTASLKISAKTSMKKS